MSYNNFSYFKSPNNQDQFWNLRQSNKSILENDRSSNFGPSKQQRQGFTQNIVLSNSNRSGQIQGTVTQLFSSFGYINDNVIFSKTDVVGSMVQIGDVVEVYATYQPNNPTKYKGERVCKLDQSHFSSNSISNFGKMKTLSQGASPRIGLPANNRPDSKYNSSGSNPRLGASLRNRLANKHESSTRAIANLAEFRRSVALKDKKNDPPAKEVTVNANTEKVNENKVDRRKSYNAQRIDLSRKSEVVKRKADSPIKVSPESKVITAIKPPIRPTVEVTVPKSIPKYYESFACRELDCAAVKNQFQTMTLPKEFFHASLKYQQSFPLNHPMKLGNNCHFKIMDKRVKCIDNFTEKQLNKAIDPEDADATFVAKVMLLSTDDLAKFYKDTLKLAEEFDGENKIPITKAIKFLVGSVGQDKEFGIGGAWSPSLDGADPETNPRVLINTAIRTCKAVTGIDLSNCSSWPKFLELHYYRPLQEIKRASADPNLENMVIDVDAPQEPKQYREPRMETVVYYIPDVWNCMPSQDNWSEITRLYLEQLTCIMCPPPVIKKPSPIVVTTTTTTTSDTVATTTTDIVTMTTTTEDSDKGTLDNEQLEEEDWNFENEVSDDLSKNSKPVEPVPSDQATHFSKLVVAGMKIVDIKKELELRKLNNRGVMEQLKARLKAALDREEIEERNKGTAVVAAPEIVTPVVVAKCLMSDDEKNELKKLYVLPEQPEIIVHQNKKLFNKEMQVQTMTLHSLLNYKSNDLPENTYELALFAKQFLDMLRRDAVFNIYKSIVVAQDKDLVQIESPEKKTKLMVTTAKRTVNRPLLFSCTLLDSTKTNRINIDNLKVLIEGLGICLSSDQLSAVLAKVKDSSNYLNYRQLTDKEMTDSDIVSMMNFDVSEDLDYIKELAIGNKALFEADANQMDASFTEDDAERLKNELDRSERCRQSIELKVAEIREETERNAKLVQTQALVIAKWKEQAVEYKSKYLSENDRGNRLKRDLDKLLRQFMDVDKISLSLTKLVADTLDNYHADNKKEEYPCGGVVKVAAAVVVVPDEIVMDLTNDAEVCDNGIDEEVVDSDPKDDIAEPETSSAPVVLIGAVASTQPAASVTTVQHSSAEDFDLSKPSDYDMVMLDETDPD